MGVEERSKKWGAGGGGLGEMEGTRKDQRITCRGLREIKEMGEQT